MTPHQRKKAGSCWAPSAPYGVPRRFLGLPGSAGREGEADADNIAHRLTIGLDVLLMFRHREL
jgi:hypothetical protein